MPELYGSDAFSPGEIAERVEQIGVNKARLPFLNTFALGVLAGGFIGLGALFYLLVVADGELSFAVQRILGGVVFSLGLILVVVAGAELFTGNNLMIMAWVSRKVSAAMVIRNFAIVYFANFAGAMGLALIVFWSGHLAMNNHAVGDAAAKVALAKVSMPFVEAFLKGVLCNILVCLAVWLAMAGRSVIDRIIAIIFPITAFVAAGFEHCIANMYFVPLAIFSSTPGVTWSGFITDNLIPVTLGNFVGGAVLVGLVYWIIYRRDKQSD